MSKPTSAFPGKSSGARGIPGIPYRFFRFFANPVCRVLVCLVLLCLFAFFDYRRAGLTRTTFVFYDIENGNELVEERMLPLPRDREEKIRFYASEALLGPALQNALPLFPRDTRLESILFREGVVYLDLSESAALPVEGGDSFQSLFTLYRGIRRNFNFVEDVRFFIAGNEAFPGKFLSVYGITALWISLEGPLTPVSSCHRRAM
ncbi:MAG: GerMN domain-containing protein [Treponema sp.]|jgi:hypothetical protein|nr:GerMN domain-containing protein [Treponema sp.]